MVAKRAEAMRLFTRNGYDWAKRYPRIAHGLQGLRVASVIIDGEAVWIGPDGITDFDKLHSRALDDDVQLYAFDLLELNGRDMRGEPLERRRSLLQALLKRSPDILFSEHFEGDGARIFEHACKFGLEGIVSKRRDLPYQSGKSKRWLKIKNPNSPAMLRVERG
jgi:bifunctional non-homologous end joining protein LigD